MTAKRTRGHRRAEEAGSTFGRQWAAVFNIAPAGVFTPPAAMLLSGTFYFLFSKPS